MAFYLLFFLSDWFQQKLAQGCKCSLHVNILLCTRLVKLTIELLAKFLCFLVADFTLIVRQIAFVADDQFTDVLLWVLLDLSHPCLNVLEWPTIGNGVHENNALSTLVVCCGYILEPILASCVPNGHFESNVTNLKNFHLKVNSNGGSVDSSELLLSKSKENIGFSNCGISNDYNFDHIVIIIHPEKNIVLTAC